MSKITTTLAVVAALLTSGAAMAQSKDFNSMVVDYGQAPGLSAKAEATVAAKTRAEVVAEIGSEAQQAALARADAELGISIPARKAAATVLATAQ